MVPRRSPPLPISISQTRPMGLAIFSYLGVVEKGSMWAYIPYMECLDLGTFDRFCTLKL